MDLIYVPRPQVAVPPPPPPHTFLLFRADPPDLDFESESGNKSESFVSGSPSMSTLLKKITWTYDSFWTRCGRRSESGIYKDLPRYGFFGDRPHRCSLFFSWICIHLSCLIQIQVLLCVFMALRLSPTVFIWFFANEKSIANQENQKCARIRDVFLHFLKCVAFRASILFWKRLFCMAWLRFLNSELGVLDETYSAKPAQWSSHNRPARLCRMDTVPVYVYWWACTATPLSGLSWQKG
jgi:hypothetical protein